MLEPVDSNNLPGRVYLAEQTVALKKLQPEPGVAAQPNSAGKQKLLLLAFLGLSVPFPARDTSPSAGDKFLKLDDILQSYG